MAKKIIYSDKAPEPIGPYSQAVLADGVLFCSGQIAAGLLDTGIDSQTKAVCENITAVVKKAGMELTDVVKTTCFLSDMNNFSIFNEVYSRYFPHKPARSCIAAKELPKGALVEIEVIAVNSK